MQHYNITAVTIQQIQYNAGEEHREAVPGHAAPGGPRPRVHGLLPLSGGAHPGDRVGYIVSTFLTIA